MPPVQVVAVRLPSLSTPTDPSPAGGPVTEPPRPHAQRADAARAPLSTDHGAGHHTDDSADIDTDHRTPSRAAPRTDHDADHRDGRVTPDDALYLPRKQLTSAPRPLAEVRIDYPPGTPSGEFSAVLLLYIDDTGQVRRISLRSGQLTPGLEAAAKAAFFAARFAPGEVAGQPVRSIYPVEVNFVTQPIARDASPR
jgi:hypothetical protein